MPIGDNSHLIDSVSVGTGIPLFLPSGTSCTRTWASGRLPGGRGNHGSSSGCSKFQPRWAFHAGIARALDTNKYFHLLFCLWAVGPKSVLILLSETWEKSWGWLNSVFPFPFLHFFLCPKDLQQGFYAATVCGREPGRAVLRVPREVRPCAWLTPPETAPLPQVGADGTRGWVWGWQEGAVLGLASFLLSASMNLGFQLELLKDLGSALFPFLSTASLHRVRLFKKLW